MRVGRLFFFFRHTSHTHTNTLKMLFLFTTPPFLHLHDPSMSDSSKYATLRGRLSNQALNRLKPGDSKPGQSQSPLTADAHREQEGGACSLMCQVAIWLRQNQALLI